MISIFLCLYTIAAYFCIKALYLLQKETRLLHEEGDWLQGHLPMLITSGYIYKDISDTELKAKIFLRYNDLESQFMDCLLTPWKSFDVKPIKNYYGMGGD